MSPSPESHKKSRRPPNVNDDTKDETPEEARLATAFRNRSCTTSARQESLRPAFALRRTVTAAGARLRDDVRTPYPHKAFRLLIETVRLPLRKPEGRERSLCRLRSQVSNSGRYRE